MSRDFCRDVLDPWRCSKSLCKKSSCAFFVPYWCLAAKISTPNMWANNNDPQLDVQEISGVQEIPSQKRSRRPKCLFYSALVP